MDCNGDIYNVYVDNIDVDNADVGKDVLTYYMDNNNAHVNDLIINDNVVDTTNINITYTDNSCANIVDAIIVDVNNAEINNTNVTDTNNTNIDIATDTTYDNNNDNINNINNININNAVIYNPLVSIVMAYHNRIEQLKLSLESISHSKYKNIEVIIIDDASEDFHSVHKIINLYNFDIKLLTISKSQKTWINPCIAYNLGFKMARGDIIIIQNPEIVHAGDVITHTVNNIQDGKYIVYSVYSSPSNLHNRYFYSMNCFESKYIVDSFINNINHDDFRFNYKYYIDSYPDIKHMNEKNALNHWHNIGRNEGRQCNIYGIYYMDTVLKCKGWYNHPIYNNRALNFLSAIKKNDLDKIGGFDPIFKNGLWYDDDDFLIRIKKIINVVNVNEEDVFGVHLYHDMGSDDLMKLKNFESLRLRNRKFKNRNAKNNVVYRDIGQIDDYKIYSLISNNKNNNITIR